MVHDVILDKRRLVLDAIYTIPVHNFLCTYTSTRDGVYSSATAAPVVALLYTPCTLSELRPNRIVLGNSPWRDPYADI